jgi:hypothetical protein
MDASRFGSIARWHWPYYHQAVFRGPTPSVYRVTGSECPTAASHREQAVAIAILHASSDTPVCVAYLDMNGLRDTLPSESSLLAAWSDSSSSKPTPLTRSTGSYPRTKTPELVDGPRARRGASTVAGGPRQGWRHRAPVWGWATRCRCALKTA